jgi:hypothetical protein
VMFALPFAPLVAAYGVITLWQGRSVLPKALAAILVVSIGWQFSVFYRRYTSDAYRLGAATWFSGNNREALRELIARSGDGRIYISRDMEWVHRMWRFYAIEAGRLDLMPRTTYFGEPPVGVAPGDKAICLAEAPRCAAMVASGAWQTVVSVPSIDGGHVYVILERTAASDKGN